MCKEGITYLRSAASHPGSNILRRSIHGSCAGKQELEPCADSHVPLSLSSTPAIQHGRSGRIRMKAVMPKRKSLLHYAKETTPPVAHVQTIIHSQENDSKTTEPISTSSDSLEASERHQQATIDYLDDMIDGERKVKRPYTDLRQWAKSRGSESVGKDMGSSEETGPRRQIEVTRSLSGRRGFEETHSLELKHVLSTAELRIRRSLSSRRRSGKTNGTEVKGGPNNAKWNFRLVRITDQHPVGVGKTIDSASERPSELILDNANQAKKRLSMLEKLYPEFQRNILSMGNESEWSQGDLDYPSEGSYEVTSVKPLTLLVVQSRFRYPFASEAFHHVAARSEAIRDISMHVRDILQDLSDLYSRQNLPPMRATTPLEATLTARSKALAQFNDSWWSHYRNLTAVLHRVRMAVRRPRGAAGSLLVKYRTIDENGGVSHIFDGILNYVLVTEYDRDWCEDKIHRVHIPYRIRHRVQALCRDAIKMKTGNELRGPTNLRLWHYLKYLLSNKASVVEREHFRLTIRTYSWKIHTLPQFQAYLRDLRYIVSKLRPRGISDSWETIFKLLHSVSDLQNITEQYAVAVLKRLACQEENGQLNHRTEEINTWLSKYVTSLRQEMEAEELAREKASKWIRAERRAPKRYPLELTRGVYGDKENLVRRCSTATPSPDGHDVEPVDGQRRTFVKLLRRARIPIRRIKRFSFQGIAKPLGDKPHLLIRKYRSSSRLIQIPNVPTKLETSRAQRLFRYIAPERFSEETFLKENLNITGKRNQISKARLLLASESRKDTVKHGQCPSCLLQCRTSAHLRHHFFCHPDCLSISRSISREQCPGCNEEFANKKSLGMHLKGTLNCLKVFRSKVDLICHGCKKEFSETDHIKMHFITNRDCMREATRSGQLHMLPSGDTSKGIQDGKLTRYSEVKGVTYKSVKERMPLARDAALHTGKFLIPSVSDRAQSDVREAEIQSGMVGKACLSTTLSSNTKLNDVQHVLGLETASRAVALPQQPNPGQKSTSTSMLSASTASDSCVEIKGILQKQIQCLGCGEAFKSLSDLEDHIGSHKPKTFKRIRLTALGKLSEEYAESEAESSQCPRGLSSYTKAMKHYEENRPCQQYIDLQAKRQCAGCNHRYKNSILLRHHLKGSRTCFSAYKLIEPNHLTCRHCETEFSTDHSIRLHIRKSPACLASYMRSGHLTPGSMQTEIGKHDHAKPKSTHVIAETTNFEFKSTSATHVASPVNLGHNDLSVDRKEPNGPLSHISEHSNRDHHHTMLGARSQTDGWRRPVEVIKKRFRLLPRTHATPARHDSYEIEGSAVETTSSSVGDDILPMEVLTQGQSRAAKIQMTSRSVQSRCVESEQYFTAGKQLQSIEGSGGDTSESDNASQHIAHTSIAQPTTHLALFENYTPINESSKKTLELGHEAHDDTSSQDHNALATTSSHESADSQLHITRIASGDRHQNRSTVKQARNSREPVVKCLKIRRIENLTSSSHLRKLIRFAESEDSYRSLSYRSLLTQEPIVASRTFGADISKDNSITTTGLSAVFQPRIPKIERFSAAGLLKPHEVTFHSSFPMRPGSHNRIAKFSSLVRSNTSEIDLKPSIPHNETTDASFQNYATSPNTYMARPLPTKSQGFSNDHSSHGLYPDISYINTKVGEKAFNAPSLGGEELVSSFQNLSVTSGQGKTEIVTHHDEKREPEVVVEPFPYHIPDATLQEALASQSTSNPIPWSYAMYRDDKDRPLVRKYCTTLEKSELAAAQFLGEKLLGFDLEWKPQTRKDQSIKEKVSVIQLASATQVVICHIAMHRGESAEELLPPSIKKIMEDPTITKVGVAIKGDCTRLRDNFNIKPRGLAELSHLHKLVKYHGFDEKLINRRLESLAKITQEHLGLPLAKDDSVRSSDWSKPLNPKQCDYAWSDAYVAVVLFHVLDGKRRALQPVPPMPYFAELGLAIRLSAGKEVLSSNQKIDEVEDAEESALFDIIENRNKYLVDTGTFEHEAASASSSVSAQLPTKKGSAGTSSNDDPVAAAQLQLAESWVDTFRTSNKSRATPACLRAYALWHFHAMSVATIASLLRTPPLQKSSVAQYILDTIRLEKLPFDETRIDDVFAFIPNMALGRYSHIRRQGKGV